MPYSDFDNPFVEHQALSAFAVLAERFCDLVESRASLAPVELQHELHRLVPTMYAAAIALPTTAILFDEEDSEVEADYDPNPADPDTVASESWRELHADLAARFGDRTYYREIFDPYPVDATDPEVVGSLADDVADIYRDMRIGLTKWQRGETGAALWEWRFNFEIHWGDHAASLLRALHSLAEMHDFGWPPTDSGKGAV